MHCFIFIFTFLSSLLFLTEYIILAKPPPIYDLTGLLKKLIEKLSMKVISLISALIMYF